jgi:invasion protein IalB
VQHRFAWIIAGIPQAMPEEGIGFRLSLNGLGEGFDKLP